MVSFTHQPFYSQRKEPPVPIGEEAVWTPEPVSRMQDKIIIQHLINPLKMWYSSNIWQQ
jgi:hypothetical protein